MLRRPVESALGPSIGVVYQSPVLARLAGVQRLLKCIQNKVRGHRRAGAPANNTAGEHVDQECYVQPALPCREWSKGPGVVELSPGLSSPNRTCTSQRIRLSVQALLIAKATSA
ncbi:hypothetical protein F01_550105 [Burkholderia cenocepacia]|nr:hypothetical protein F01_550105 [Burkholderia cenocepacia]